MKGKEKLKYIQEECLMKEVGFIGCQTFYFPLVAQIRMLYSEQTYIQRA